jgi:hypothetical protein
MILFRFVRKNLSEIIIISLSLVALLAFIISPSNEYIVKKQLTSQGYEVKSIRQVWNWPKYKGETKWLVGTQKGQIYVIVNRWEVKIDEPEVKQGAGP